MNCRMRTSFRLLGMPQRKNRAVTSTKGRMFCMGRSGCLEAPTGSVWVLESLIIAIVSRGLEDHVGVLNRVAGPDQPDGQRNALLQVRVRFKDHRQVFQRLFELSPHARLIGGAELLGH